MSNTLKIGIDFTVIIMMYFCYFERRWKSKGSNALVVNTVMYVYLTGVLYFTLMPILVSLPFIFNHPYRLMNLSPFEDYCMGRGDTVRQIVLNVIMTMPFGFLLPICRKCKGKKCSIGTCLLFTAAMSFGIEVLQPLIDGFRASDVTDIITNTVGGALGYLCYIVLQPVVDKVLKAVARKSAM